MRNSKKHAATAHRALSKKEQQVTAGGYVPGDERARFALLVGWFQFRIALLG